MKALKGIVYALCRHGRENCEECLHSTTEPKKP